MTGTAHAQAATLPCGSSLDAAYDAARPGDVIQLGNCSYGSNTITGSKAAPRVVFQGGAGTTASLEIYAPNIEFRRGRLAWNSYCHADNLAFRDVSHSYFGISGSDNVTISGGESYPNAIPVRANYNPQITEANGEAGCRQDPPEDILVEGVHFHDWLLAKDVSGPHIDCLQFGAGIRVTIRGNRFSRCEHSDMFIRSWAGINGGVHPIRNFTIENNRFDKTASGYYVVEFGADLNPAVCSGNVIRHNSWRQDFRVDPTSCSDTQIYANAGVQNAAGLNCSRHRYRNNVWVGTWSAAAKCAASDKALTGEAALRWDADYRLQAGSPAIDAGDPGSHPAVDFEGQARPAGAGPDAGADETGASAPPPDPDPDPEPTPDTQPPSVPQGMAWAGKTTTTVSLRWNASTDNVGVTGYRLYRNGVLVTTTTNLNYTFTGLACGTSYTFALEAIDAAGNASNRAEATGTTTTEPCPTTDTQPPSVPQGMAWAGKTATTVSLRWDASTDNVGVTGYRLYRNGVLVATTTNLNYTFTGLSCGTSYTFALEAIDAAGNASNRAEATGTTTTNACT